MQSYANLPQEYELSHQADYGRAAVEPIKPKRPRRANYARGGKRPAAFNGIHRRRKKRWSW